MFKRLIFTFSLLIAGIAINAQTYQNEWINYNQSYYKILIAKDGIYKIDSLALAQAGIPVASIDPRKFQLFQRGQEMYIHVSGENDGVFNANDEILFFAKKNSGREDSSLYYTGNFLCNPYHSLINDTAAVFFTWNSSLSNRRLTVETDTAFSSYTPIPYFINQSVIAIRDNYFYGPQTSVGTTDPRYTHGEGFMDQEFGLGQSKTYTFNTSTLYQGGPSINATIAHAGRSNPYYLPDHDVSIEYQNGSGGWVGLSAYSYEGYSINKEDFVLDPATVGNNLAIRINNVSNPVYNANATGMGVYFTRIIFPSTFNLLGRSTYQMFIPDAVTQSKSYVSVSNFIDPSNSPVIIDVNSNKLYNPQSYSGGFRCLIPNTGSLKECYISSADSIKNITLLKPVNGTGTFVNYLNQAGDSAFLIVTNKKLSSSANQYASYRQSFAGGGHHVVVAYIDDLIDQFAYGITGHPYAVKNYIKYLIANYPGYPKNLLLLGKSVHQNECVTNASKYAKNLVPSFGYPAADNLFSQAITYPSSLAPDVPTGRLSVNNDAEALAYLAKIILHESQAKGQDWQKNILHFVGGTSNYEQTVFNGYMQTNKGIAEDTLLGANVTTIKKTTTAPIAINTNDSIEQMIERGLSLITFFGHGSTTGFEQNIDDPYSFNNSPRFPFLVANSCYTGDIHTPDIISASEKFVLADDHGTIGFLASVSSGISYALQMYTEEFYKNLSYRLYGKSYGEIIQEAVRRVEVIPTSINDSIVKVTCIEMSLEGDPSVTANVNPLPDYELSNADVHIDADSQIDKINIDIHFNNYGKVVNDSIKVYIERMYPSGNITAFYKTVHAPAYATDINFDIDKDIVNSVGLNKFYVKVDYFNAVAESNESNNATIGYISAFVRGGDVYPVYPYKYAIIPDVDKITLKASTSDPFASSLTYRIQVDTGDAFSNPFINTTVISSGGVISLPISLMALDSMVYFWRIGKDTANLDSINWRESTFQSISSKTGWSQAHFHQFKNDKYQFVTYNKPQRKFEFNNNIRTVFCRTGFVGSPNPPFLNFADNCYYFDNAQQNTWTCGNDIGWSFAIFDSISGLPLHSDTTGGALGNGTWLSNTYNSCMCVPTPRTVFDFGLNNHCGDNSWNTSVYVQRMTDFLNLVPVGDYVLAYSHNRDSAHVFTSALHQAFSLIGSDSIQYKKDTCQMIIFGKKLAAPHNGAHETMGDSLLDVITSTDTFSTKWNNGIIESEIIGPALAWKSFHWRFKSNESPSTDSIYIKIFGIRADGTADTTALATFLKDSLDVPDLYNYVDVQTYPYIKLVAYEADYVNYTAPQLKRWQVIYDQVPEAAINPNAGYSINKSIVSEGDEIIVRLPIQNIGNVAFTDSLLVSYWIESASGVEYPLNDKLKAKPFLPDSIFIDTIHVNTYGYPGVNALWVDVNKLGHTRHQLEQEHFNNIARIPFEVKPDNINPLLDVTFDGVHILNGDIVSSKPQILISLKDENKFLALNDTSDFTVKLKYPNAQTETQLYFDNKMTFTPAVLPNNSCKIDYMPDQLADGVYELIVQARDRSLNVSGASEYKIQFEVVNKASITEVLNYPNPFSTSTKFVFTLTGNQVPETFKIQIMTISGKVVKEINKEEIGNIRIGRNITEYSWNGKDEFGDQLANGVYLYRVVTRLNGEEIEKRETAADEYFKKGWGKLVIMR